VIEVVGFLVGRTIFHCGGDFPADDSGLKGWAFAFEKLKKPLL